jgi:MFS family permease
MIVLDYSFVQNPAGGSNRPMNPPRAEASTTAVCLAGALALAVAMGIGRFAFTPLLPLMQREGLVGADGGAALAAVNYGGYLLGALTAARLAVHPRRLVLAGLLATAAATAAAGAVQGLAAWLLLRGLAGVLSAWVMVGVSSWAIGTLARRGRADAGGRVYAGVGLGIAATGALAWWRAADSVAALWQQLGLLALVAAVFVAACWRSEVVDVARPTAPAGGDARGHRGLILCYGLFGFGYILPATYLPAMARALVDDPRLFGLAWPVFGAAAALSTLAAGPILARWSRPRVWALCHVLLAAGCVLPLASRSGMAIAFAALAVGGSFMVATMAGLQLARDRAAANPAPLLARLVAAFALGQIAGPLVALLLARLAGGGDGLAPTLLLAAAALAASAVWLQRQSDPRPHRHPPDRERPRDDPFPQPVGRPPGG